MDNVGTSLSQAMRELRQKLNYSQDEFASALSISRSYVAGMETGIRVPAFPIFYALRTQFGFDLNALIDQIEEKS